MHNLFFELKVSTSSANPFSSKRSSLSIAHRFLQTTSLVVFILASLGCATSEKQATEAAKPRQLLPQNASLPILQGLTSETSTLINVIAETPDKVELRLSEAHPEARIESREITWPGATEKIVRAKITGLKPSLTYELVVFRNDQLVDRREFAALNPQHSNFRVLIGSCMNDGEKSEEIEAIWSRALEREPDAMFLIGDNVYADWVNGRYLAPANGAQLWRRYAETMSRLPVYRWKRLVPILATWDDHDFGVNDGDRRHPYKDEARAVFMSFFPQEAGLSSAWTSGPGVASRWNAFGFVFHFLDARSFRAPRNESTSAPQPQTQLGEEQEAWLLSGLEPQKLNFLIKGDQWWGAYHRFESYEGSHPQGFQSWLSRLRENGATTVMMSGDRHLSEVMKISKEVLGYETYELTASPVHARKYNGDWKKIPNKRQIFGIDQRNNWLEIEIPASSESRRSATLRPVKKQSATPLKAEFKVRYWGEAPTELYSLSIQMPIKATKRPSSSSKAADSKAAFAQNP